VLKRLLIAGFLLSAGSAALLAVPRGAVVSGTNLYVSSGGHTECHCVQVASEELEREVGLSPDGSPAPFSAMAFTWSTAQVPSFWMKNTAGPLQVAFADSTGEVQQVEDLTSCTSGECPIVTSNVLTRLVVEAPDLEALGIVPGVLLSLGDGCEVRE
jgi:uncharacterized membrane protein (UPF0127 family)